ncbi:MAG: sulfatase-like hydrolase/transferase [bacterium]
MNKGYCTRRQLLIAAGAATLAAATNPARAASTTNRRRPNFLVIFTDDQTYRAIGYNNPSVKTPTLDRLAANGVIFDNAYVASPICVASRASILTGVFPQQHGAIALNAGEFRNNVIIEQQYKTLPQVLTEHGYTSALYGKSHLGDPTQYGFQQGAECNDEQAFQHAESFFREISTEKRPFFLWLAPRKPHLPLKPDGPWLNLYKDAQFTVDPNFREAPLDESFFNQGLPGEDFYRDSDYTDNYKNLPAGPLRSKEVILEFIKAYYATISYLDYQIEELVACLKSTGLYENTVIIFLSDNGYFLGNHGLGNKITMHEESVRVPMLIHSVRLPTKGARCNELVSSLDVYPTILELAGIEEPNRLMGKSLSPLFSNPRANLREYVAAECVGVGGSRGQGHRMVRTKQWKYILSGTNEEALFDEVDDPYEMTNLASNDDSKEILATLRQYMKEWMDAVADTHMRPPSK